MSLSRHPLVIITVLVGISVSMGGAILEYHRVSKVEQVKFVQQAQECLKLIGKTLDTHLNFLESVRDFYGATQFVSRKEFRVFVGRFLREHSAPRALAWIPRVPENERETFEVMGKAETNSDFYFKERSPEGEWTSAESRSEYFPVYYLEENEKNTLEPGFDFGSSETELEALNRARISGHSVATEPAKAGESKNGKTFVVLDPIYKNSAPIATPTDRWGNLSGLAVGVFNLDDLVESSLGILRNAQIDTAIFETRSGSEAALIYFRDSGPKPQGQPITLAVPTLAKATSQFHVSDQFEVGRRTWTIVCLPHGLRWFSGLRRFPFHIFFAGAAFTLIIAGYLLTVLRRTEEIEKLVSARTAELMGAKQQLEKENGKRKRVQKLLELQARALQSQRTAALNMMEDAQEAKSKSEQAEQRLSTQAEELLRSNRDLEQFAYVASHDLQEPLRTVVSFATLLEKRNSDRLNGDSKEYLQFMVSGALRMQSLIQDLLAYSKVARGELHKEPIDLREIVKTVLKNLDAAVKESGCQVRVDPLPTLQVNRGQMQQLFQNLISNAIKYRAHNPPAVRISSIRSREGFLITVEDNGLGIEAKHFERVFIIFQRLHTDSDNKGTGIGLAVCKKIVERHGGKIWVESEPGKGSRFRFILPPPSALDQAA